jgi:hypothetical protein
MNISKELRVSGAGPVWEMVVQKGITYFDYVKFLPLLAGIFLAISQYAPEMASKRLKLTLHLPLPETRIMLTMLFFGIVSLAIIFFLSYSVINTGMNFYFTYEIANWNLSAVQPWLWGGLIAYTLTTWICIEPVWRQRIFNTLVGISIVALFYFNAVSEAYRPFLPYLIILVMLSISFSFYSLIRFKDGEQ